MAEDSGGITAGGLCKKCNCRGSFGSSSAKVTKSFAGCNFIQNFVPRETTADREVAPDKKVIVPLTVFIPEPLRAFCEGQSRIEIEESPATLAGVLAALWIHFPGLRDRIVTEQGDIRQHINIFIGDDDVRFTGGLTSRIPPEAEISIVPSISGG